MHCVNYLQCWSCSNFKHEMQVNRLAMRRSSIQEYASSSSGDISRFATHLTSRWTYLNFWSDCLRFLLLKGSAMASSLAVRISSPVLDLVAPIAFTSGSLDLFINDRSSNRQMSPLFNGGCLEAYKSFSFEIVVRRVHTQRTMKTKCDSLIYRDVFASWLNPCGWTVLAFLLLSLGPFATMVYYICH